MRLCGDDHEGTTCRLQAGHGGEWHSDGDEKWPRVPPPLTEEEVRAEVREVMNLAAALKLLEEPLTEVADLLAKAHTALEDPDALNDDDFADFIDGSDQLDANSSRLYAIALLERASVALAAAGARP